MSGKGYEIIGIGRKRVVYDLRNGYVLKVAKSKSGTRSNKTELAIYRSRRFSPVRKHLAAIAKHGRDWLIMKKFTRPFTMTKRSIREYHRLRSKFRKLGILPRDMYSMTHKGPSLTNLRTDRMGRVIVIDYGNFIIK